MCSEIQVYLWDVRYRFTCELWDKGLHVTCEIQVYLWVVRYRFTCELWGTGLSASLPASCGVQVYLWVVRYRFTNELWDKGLTVSCEIQIYLWDVRDRFIPVRYGCSSSTVQVGSACQRKISSIHNRRQYSWLGGAFFIFSACTVDIANKCTK